MKLRSHLHWRQKLIHALSATPPTHVREEDAWLGIG